MSMFRLIRLEERIVLDGAGITDLLNQMEQKDAHDQAVADGQQDASQVDASEPLSADALDMATPMDEGLHVLVISSQVNDADDLAAAAKDDVLVIRYDAANTSLEDLAGLIDDALDGRKADSIAFASHNAGGAEVALTGTAVTTADTLLSDAGQRAFWQAVGENVADNGRIDILACDVANGEAGESLLQNLEKISGRNVAASTDATGNEAYGGDWVLESDGVDVSGTYFDAQKLQSFDGVLLSGEDPDFGYNKLYAQQVPKINTAISIPTSLWNNYDDASAIQVSANRPQTWVYWGASAQKLYVYGNFASVGNSVDVTFTAKDGEPSTNQQTLHIDIVDATQYNNRPTLSGTAVTVVEGDANGTVVADMNATDPDGGTPTNFTIVSGNPTDGLGNYGFAIDPTTGVITIANTSLLNYGDTYIANDHTYDLVVRATDDEGMYGFTTLTVPIQEGEVTYELGLNVTPTRSLAETGTATKATVEVTVDRIDKNLHGPLTVTLGFGGSGVSPASYPADYTIGGVTPVGNTIVVTLGPGNLSETFDIYAVNDGTPEGNENFTVDILSFASASDTVFDAVDSLQTFTLSDSKPTLALIATPASMAEGGLSAAGAQVKATLTGGTFSTTQVVELSMPGGTTAAAGAPNGSPDYLASSLFLTFAPGATQSDVITLKALPDNVAEGAETFNIAVTGSNNPFEVANSATVTITDATVNLPVVDVNIAATTVAEGNSTIVNVTLVGGTTAVDLPVTVTISGGTPGVDYSGLALQQVTIPAGGFQTSFTLGTLLDAPDGAGGTTLNEVLTINAVDQWYYNPGAVDAITVIDSASTPSPGVGIEVLTGSIAENGVSSFRVFRTDATNAVDVYFTLGGAATIDTDYTQSGANTFSGNYWVAMAAGVTQKFVTINAIDDSDPEIDEDVQVGLVAPSGYTLQAGQGSGAITIVDDDPDPVVKLSWNGPSAVREGDSGFLFAKLDVVDAGGNAVTNHPDIVINLDDAGLAVLGTDFTVVGGTTITIPFGSSTKSIQVNDLGDDKLIEGTEAFTLSIVSVQNAVTSGMQPYAIAGTVLDSVTTPAPGVTVDITPSAIYESSSSTPNEAAVTSPSSPPTATPSATTPRSP